MRPSSVTTSHAIHFAVCHLYRHANSCLAQKIESACGAFVAFQQPQSRRAFGRCVVHCEADLNAEDTPYPQRHRTSRARNGDYSDLAARRDGEVGVSVFPEPRRKVAGREIRKNWAGQVRCRNRKKKKRLYLFHVLSPAMRPRFSFNRRLISAMSSISFFGSFSTEACSQSSRQRSLVSPITRHLLLGLGCHYSLAVHTYKKEASLAVATLRPAFRVARFNAERTLSFDSANSASGTLSAESALKLSRSLRIAVTICLCFPFRPCGTSDCIIVLKCDGPFFVWRLGICHPPFSVVNPDA